MVLQRARDKKQFRKAGIDLGQLSSDAGNA
jgi:hypothetical protein